MYGVNPPLIDTSMELSCSAAMYGARGCGLTAAAASIAATGRVVAGAVDVGLSLQAVVASAMAASHRNEGFSRGAHLGIPNV